MRRHLLAIALVSGLPALLSAGQISLPVTSVSGQVIFSNSPNTLGYTQCDSPPACTFSGSGTVSLIPLQWLVTIVPGINPVSFTGPPYSVDDVNENGASITFSLTDSPGADSISGNMVLDTVQTDPGDSEEADLIGDVTINNVSFAGPGDGFALALGSALGQAPANGLTLNLDVVFACDGNCLDVPDPTGSIVGADLSTTAPEPATWVLLCAGLGLLALWRLKTS